MSDFDRPRRPNDSRDDLALDARLRQSGRRVAHSTDALTGDLPTVIAGSRRKKQRTNTAIVGGFAVIVLLVAVAGFRRGSNEQQIGVAGDPAARPTVVAPSSPPTTAGTTDASDPGVAELPFNLASVCELETIKQVVDLNVDLAISSYDRYACSHPWISARFSTVDGQPHTYIFKWGAGGAPVVSRDADAEPDALRDAGVPVDWLYIAMGLPRPVQPPAPDEPPVETTTTTTPEVEIVDAEALPEGVLAKALGQFIHDVQPDTLKEDTGGDVLAVYDGMLLEPTTARRFTDAEKDVITQALADAGITVEFVDVTGTTERPALLLADPLKQGFNGPNGQPLELADGEHLVFFQLQGCTQSCGLGATYRVSPSDSPDDGGWKAVAEPIEPVVG